MYFLFCGNKLVYVGRSTTIGNRIVESIANKLPWWETIDKFAYFSTQTKANMTALEAFFIAKYKPRLNNQSKPDDELTIRLEYEVDVFALKRHTIYERAHLSSRAA